MDKARYTHNCIGCQFLGNYDDFDLYVCSQGDKEIDTLVARYGDELEKFIYGVDLAVGIKDMKLHEISESRWALIQALMLALKLGYYVKR
jgi:hypothetical protein